nr:PREDICTED: venom acid phosphatase Acph-1-like [Megachile rotundata]
MYDNLFRHGDRTPSKREVYPNLPPNPIYDKLGYGELTDVGKKRAQDLGKMLRQRYDKFLGKAQYNEVYAISTDFDRTKMTLQLVLNGLYPPTKNASWDQMTWSPIPTLYLPLLLDTVLFPQACPIYVYEWLRLKFSDAMKKELDKYADLFQYLIQETGLTAKDNILLAARLYQLLLSQRSMNMALPKWATDKVQKALEQIVTLDYNIQSYTPKLKRLNGGTIVKRLLRNIRDKSSTAGSRRKIYLYSGHDVNIASFTKVNGFPEPTIPPYGSAFIVETWKTVAGKRYIQMYYWTGITEQLKPMKIPNCQEQCPLEEYEKLMQSLIPTDEESACLWNTVTMKYLQEYYRLLEY